MNNIFKIVWCASKNCWMVVSELAAGAKKNKTRAVKTVVIVSFIGLLQSAIAQPNAITTDGNGLYGIYDNGANLSKVIITNDNAINTSGLGSHAIYAVSTKGAHIVNSGDISIQGSESVGIKAEINNTGANSDGITIIQENSTIQTSNLGDLNNNVNSSGIRAIISAKTGDINIKLTDSVINVDGRNSDGIIAQSLDSDANLDINIETNGGSIDTLKSGQAKSGLGNLGIAVTQADQASGDIRIVNKGTKITTGVDVNGSASLSSAIYAVHTGVNSTGNIYIQNNGDLHTRGFNDNSSGIYAIQGGEGNTVINNMANITTTGNDARGIYSSSYGSGDVVINNLGCISTMGEKAHGINIYDQNSTFTGRVRVMNTGDIHTTAHSTDGIRVHNNTHNNGILIQSLAGVIETNGGFSHGISAFNKGVGQSSIGIENSSKIITTGGRITPTDTQGAMGIYIEQHHTGNVNVLNKGELLTSDQAIRLFSYGKNNVVTNYGNISTKNYNQENIHNHGIYVSLHDYDQATTINHISGLITVEGLPRKTGNSIGVALTSVNAANSQINLVNGAQIDAASGMSGIQVINPGNSEINISAGSKVQGGADSGINVKNGTIVVNNAGTLSATNDRVFKIEPVDSVKINNTGSIQGFISAQPTSGVVDLDNDGSFLVRQLADSTYSINSTAYTVDTKKVAISHFNEGTINNGGTIELMAVNGLANNDPTGEYVPVGALSSANEGIQHGQLLGVKEFNHSGALNLVGSGLSGNVMVISGGNTAGTNGNGTFITNGGTLKVATTLNKGGADSRSDMLVVDNLQKGSESTKIDVTIAAGSQDVKTVGSGIQIVKTLGTQDAGAFDLAHVVTYGHYEYLLFSDNGQGDSDGYYLRNYLKYPLDPPTYLPNPNVGAALGNHYAAAHMFNQNILDRRDNVRVPDQTVWGRIQYNEVRTNHMNDTQKLSIDNTLIQLGVDLYQDHEKGHIVGVYAGYGNSDIKNTSRLTGSKAEGSVDGFQIGAYYSWMPQADQGPYVDVWGHYATYHNKLKGQTQRGLEKKYDGYGFAVSAEAGYGFIMSENTQTKWILEPHAQVTYNYINMDDFTDHNNTRFSNNKSKGFDLRLGARFYGYHPEDNGLLPFVELNWLHNGMDNDVHVNGSKVSSRIGRNVGELKLGFKGNLSKESSIFAHVGLEKGSNKYKKTKFQIGFNYNW